MNDSAATPEPFEAPQLEELAPHFPAYSIDGFIAKGGMGAVYLGKQLSLDRRVAIKLLPRELGADPVFRDSFQAEAKAMAKLNHPNLIGVYDFGEADGMPFIVMEYVEGKPLHYSAHGKIIDPDEAGRIVLATCRGLHHAHENDILHRDVKPGNILLDKAANPKLGDFGLAQPMADSDAEEMVYGTPGYAAPEVYEGGADHRADTYAAAIVLYELLTGQLPSDPYQHPSQQVRCDRRYDSLLFRAIQPNPDKRHADAADFADELESILKTPAPAVAATTINAPPGFAPSRPPARPPLVSHKTKGPSPMVVGFFLALGVIAAVTYIFWPGDDELVAPTATTDPPGWPLAEDPLAPVIPPPDEPDEIVAAPVPVPEPVPAPEPVPIPVEEPTPIVMNDPPDPMPEPVEPPPPADDPPPPEEPVSTFDHAGFLEKGRTTLRNSAASILEEHDEELLKNIDRLERAEKRVLRDVDYLSRERRRLREDDLETYIESLEKMGRIPKSLPNNLPKALSALSYDDVAVISAINDALEKQDELEFELKGAVRPLLDAYQKGIRKQAEKLRAEDNAHDAGILEAEADRVAADLPGFIAMLRGEEGTTAGSDDPARLIVGEWKRTDMPNFLFTFFSDNSCTSRISNMTGDWEVRDGMVHIQWKGRHAETITMDPDNPDEATCLSGVTGNRFKLFRLAR